MQKLSVLLATIAILASCATQRPPSGGEIDGEQTKLCIQDASGFVRLYVGGRTPVGRTPRPDGGCIDIPDYIVRDGTNVQLCVTTTAMNECVFLPRNDFSTSLVWSLRLGFFTDTWDRDVFSLKPAQNGEF